MRLKRLKLIKFLESIPKISKEASLSRFLALFRSSRSDRLVIVDGKNRVFGLVRLADFLGIWERQGETSDSNLDVVAIAQPLETLSADLDFTDFWQHFTTNSEPKELKNYALIDSKGAYVGLLDFPSILHYLAQSQIAFQTHPQSVETHLEFFIQLLEHLPLPAILQTDSGEVIGHNQNWEAQIGGIPSISQIDSINELNLFNNGEINPSSGSSESTSSQHNLAPYWQFIKIALPQSLFADATSVPANSLLWLVVAVDTSHQQQVAAELMAKNADLVQLNRLKDEFLACVSHELKTPLTTVLGLSTLLKAGQVGELNERQNRYLGLIDKSGRQLMTVVNDILDLTKLETSQVQLELRPCKIAAICDRAYQQALQIFLGKPQPPDAEEIGIDFSLEIDPEVQNIVADEQRLGQMLSHLLSNALKFTKKGGEIGLQVSHRQGWIAFTVWDTGIGIPSEKQHLLFEKFQQLESPLTREFEGIGLGLVLTQRLARLHGGDLSFTSEHGKGSQFTLLLPPIPPRDWRFSLVEEGVEDKAKLWETGELAHQLKSLTPHRAVSSKLILVAETVPRYIEDLTVKLSSLGYWAIVARSGTEAIEKARQFQPAAILLNPMLPVLSGWDALTLLKADDRTRHLPVAIAGTAAEKEVAWQSQADDFLILPIDTSYLEQTLARLTKLTGHQNRNLAILHLTAPYRFELLQSFPEELSTSATQPLHTLVSQLNYRVLEADDLEQAELLVKVWQPDVIVFDAVGIEEPVTYLAEFSRSPHLGKLPLVTVGEKATQAANQVKNISVFPCLSVSGDSVRATSHLLKVIQMASGIVWQHGILVLDVANMGAKVSKSDAGERDSPKGAAQSDRFLHDDWLVAATQYLHTAGFKSVFSHTWSEVKTQLAAHYFDLLLIYWENLPSEAEVRQELTALIQTSDRPPVLLLDRTCTSEALFPKLSDLSEIDRISTRNNVLRGDSYTMAELVTSIERAIAASR